MDQPQASSAHQPTHHPTDTPSPGQRIIVIDAILDVIFSFSTPRAIINISKTCRAARPIAASYFRAAYKPDRLLQRFLPDPAIMRAFRTLQAETGLTIFGKAAYNFLARASPTSTDITATMSLYVDNPYASAVNDFFTGAGYNVELREHELVFLKTGEDDQIINEIALYVGQPDSFDFVDKPQILLVEFTDVITFDGAYSLFPAQYDDELGGESASPAAKKKPQYPLLAVSKPMYRSFSDRSSWVVTFNQRMPVISPPQLAFGTSLPARDPLYTSSVLVGPPKGHFVEPCIQLRGVVLRSRLLRLAHILGCVQLSQFVQQFLTRLVIAHPGRSNSHFDSEVAQFLRVCLELVDIRHELPSYSAVWAVMKVGLLSLLLQLRLRELMLELGDGAATIRHPRYWRVTMAMLNLVEAAGSRFCTDSTIQPWGVIYANSLRVSNAEPFSTSASSLGTEMVRWRRVGLMGWLYRNSIPADLFYIQPLSAWIQCEAQANPTSRELQSYTKGLEDFRPQRHSLIDTLRKSIDQSISHDLVRSFASRRRSWCLLCLSVLVAERMK